MVDEALALVKQAENTIIEEENRRKRKREETEKNLTCEICADLLAYPYTLNCSHSFCKLCLDGWITSNKLTDEHSFF